MARGRTNYCASHRNFESENQQQADVTTDDNAVDNSHAVTNMRAIGDDVSSGLRRSYEDIEEEDGDDNDSHQGIEDMQF